MSRIMEDIADITGGRSFQSYKYSFDSIRTPSPNYDDTMRIFGDVWQSFARQIRPTVSYRTGGGSSQHIGDIGTRGEDLLCDVSHEGNSRQLS